VAVRAVRGAIQVDRDSRDAILEGSAELVRAVLERNDLTSDDIISIVFTATPDLTAEFPAYAARLLGLTDVPLLCATEIPVPGALPRTLRLLAHVDTPRARSELRHPYLRGAAALRTDLPH
jgi:chorismate mutase